MIVEVVNKMDVSVFFLDMDIILADIAEYHNQVWAMQAHIIDAPIQRQEDDVHVYNTLDALQRMDLRPVEQVER